MESKLDHTALLLCYKCTRLAGRTQTSHTVLRCKQTGQNYNANNQTIKANFRVYKRQAKAATKLITRRQARLDAVFGYMALVAYLMTIADRQTNYKEVMLNMIWAKGEM